MKLEKRISIITGAKRGIGLAIATQYAAEGSVVVLADIVDAESEAADLRSAGHEAVSIQTDVTSEKDVSKLVEEVVQKFGRVDVLVNNAGVEFAKTIVDTTGEEWDWLMAVNVKGVFLCSKITVPVMEKQGRGVIINVASELGLVGEANVAAYCASKGAVVMLTKGMAIDHGPKGVRVNCLCPGPVTTQLLEDVFASSADPEALRSRFEASTVLHRLGKPEEIAKAAVFLASDDSSFMAGANLVADGGWTTR